MTTPNKKAEPDSGEKELLSDSHQTGQKAQHTPSATIPTPALDRMLAVHPQSQAIGEFLEWLQSEKEIELAKRHKHTGDCRSFAIYGKDFAHQEELEDGRYRANQCGLSEHALYIQHYSTEKLLAEFFEIDLQQADNEKCAILASLQ